MNYQPAHDFLARINVTGLPNESPAALLLRSHRSAKALLPRLLTEQREAAAKAETQTERDKFLHREASFDLFLEDAYLTRDAYVGRGEMEPEEPARLDAWGNVRR